MIGQSAPIGEPNRFVEHITSLARRVRELELTKRPFIQSGSDSVSLSASGGSVTFPVEFSAPPSVQITPAVVSANERTCHLTGVTTTGFTLRSYNAGTEETSGTRTIHWIAVL